LLARLRGDANQDIAEALGVSGSTATQHYRSAVAALRNYLAEVGFTTPPEQLSGNLIGELLDSSLETSVK
jgi:DNA-binding transcriptional ArsR family regulator